MVEAFLCGVEVIGPSSGSIPATIGEDGYGLPEGDEAALSETMRTAVGGAGADGMAAGSLPDPTRGPLPRRSRRSRAPPLVAFAWAGMVCGGRVVYWGPEVEE